MYTIESIKKHVAELITQAVNQGVEVNASDIVLPPDREMGDFALAGFKLSSLAKEKNKPLPKIISEIADHINESSDDIIEQVKAVGPYLNFFLNKEKFAQSVLQEIFSMQNNYGNSKAGKNKKVMIEYSQPNTHKEFHVGHLRNVCLGMELIKLYRAAGYQVIAANYFGDAGAHVATCLWGLQKKGMEEDVQNKGEYLGELYVWAVKQVAEHPEYKEEVRQVQQKLEDGDKELTDLWKKTRQWSLDEFHQIYKDLGAHFDVEYFDSDQEKPGKKFVQELLDKGIAKKSEGAVIVDLTPYELDVFLILRSDGTALYATKDLALAKQKFEDYDLDQSNYVIDVRQSFYFKQLFKTLELMGFEKPMHHLSYEMVTLPGGAMSSRKGNVVTFRELEKVLLNNAYEATKERHKDWPEEELRATAQKISYAAMKFDILKHDAGKVMVFNIKEALSFDGFTGPYILYSITRIFSILRRAENEQKQISYAVLELPIEKKLLMELARFPEVLDSVLTNFQMSLLPRYLYDLAKMFAEFYHNVPVLKAEEEVRQARLQLIQAVKTVLIKGLDILGIEYLEEM